MARHLSEPRDISVSITGAVAPEAIGAIGQKIYQLEDQYEKSLDETGTSQNLTDLAAVNIVLTGNTPFKIYVFELTTTFATGTYAFTFVESAPNVESSTVLNP